MWLLLLARQAAEQTVDLPLIWDALMITTPSVTVHSEMRLVCLINLYSDVIMDAIASQITSLAIAYLTLHSGVDQIKHHSSASLAFVRGFHRWPVNSPHKGPVTRKLFPFDDVMVDMYSSEEMPRQQSRIYLYFQNCNLQHHNIYC